MSAHHHDAAPSENELERLLKLAVTEPPIARRSSVNCSTPRC